MTTLMLAEAHEAPERVADALKHDTGLYAELARKLRQHPPRFAATIARGSSDHAASFAASLIGIDAGLATASIPPSLVTRYGARLALDGALVLGLSQSGASPDIVRTLAAARSGGALTVAIVNAAASPLTDAADYVLHQRAGAERSVAATKSFILTLVAIARLVAVWRDDAALCAALERLPDHLRAALACDWSAAVPIFAAARNLYVIGRGPALAIASESALKFKETCQLHAEAVSAVEIQHGPRAVIDADFPVLAYGISDPGGSDARAVAAELARGGGTVALAAPVPGAGLHLPLPPPLHPRLDPIVAVAAFYVLAEAVARARGLDPDHPRNLQKVTRTV
jgi:glucosamine--fructose-6-phosphate aminotransferase (isomerizing)